MKPGRVSCINQHVEPLFDKDDNLAIFLVRFVEDRFLMLLKLTLHTSSGEQLRQIAVVPDPSDQRGRLEETLSSPEHHSIKNALRAFVHCGYFEDM
jgi:hypothetical protein